jgi:hypothetical protein
MEVPMFRNFFDPDRNWKSWDKVQHAFLALLLCALLTLHFSRLESWLITLLVGAAWELAGWDVARGTFVEHELGDMDRVYEPTLGHPGYGFGLLDLAAVAVGAFAWILVLWVATIF